MFLFRLPSICPFLTFLLLSFSILYQFLPSVPLSSLFCNLTPSSSSSLIRSHSHLRRFFSGGRAIGGAKGMRVHSDDVSRRGQHVALSQCGQTPLHPHARLSSPLRTVGMHEAHRLPAIHRQKNRFARVAICFPCACTCVFEHVCVRLSVC